MQMNQQHRTDFYGWTMNQANLLRAKEFSKMDMDHLIEEIENLGKSEKRTLKSYLEKLLMHKLKSKIQPGKHSRSWDLTIENCETQTRDCLSENPSLKPMLKEILKSSYYSARILAILETGLTEELFPEECPWTLQDIFPDLEKKYW